MITLMTTTIQWICALLLTLAALWTIQVAPDWAGFGPQRTLIYGLLVVAFGMGLLPARIWRRFVVVRILAPVGLVLAALVAAPGELPGYALVIVTFACLNGLLLVVSWMLKDESWGNLGNFAVSVGALVLTLVVVELLAPPVTHALANIQRQAALAAAAAEAARPLDPDEIDTAAAAVELLNASPQTEVIVEGGGPAWGLQTGWGTRTDSTIRYYMDGVYDHEIVYNHLGFRGPEIAYEKPDDIYRILLIGDSFIEAREVAYEDTIYVQLSTMLADMHTADGKRVEVFGVGATGWGTLQKYLYYHHEGYRFQPDLIVDFFIINDVADNNPQVLYKDRDIDFSIDDDQVIVVSDDTIVQAQVSDPGSRWLDALPQPLAQTHTAALIRRLVAPPRESVTLAGNLGNAHPQNYIFVREPQIEGYPEGWRRTKAAYEIWAKEAQANAGQLVVVAVDISVERITEISTYYPEEQDQWVWDVDWPYTRLAAILEPLDVTLIVTRNYYADYAESVNRRPYDLLFYLQDGHWNPTGHQVTAALLAGWLHESGIVQPG